MKLLRTFSGRRSLVACLGLTASLVFSGCRSADVVQFSSDVPSGSAPENAGESDVFAVGNIVTVAFSGVSEMLLPHEETIKEDGTITLPLIGAVKAAGKSAGELQKEIHNRYVPKYYNSNLTVTVKSQLRVYYVGGQVKAPGRQEYIGTTTVTKAIQSAGDFTDFAKKTAVELTRAGSKKPIKVDCKKALKDPSKDLPVYPGDKIHVPQRIW